MILLNGCGNPKKNPSTTLAEPTAVETAPIFLSDSLPPLKLTGTLHCEDTLSLAFKMGGRLATVTAREGDFVKQGTLLAAIDQDEFKSQLDIVEQQQAKAERDYIRAQTLANDSVIADENFENAKTLWQQASAGLERARYNLSLTELTAPKDCIILERLGEPLEIVSPGQPVLNVCLPASGWKVTALIAQRDRTFATIGARVEINIDNKSYTGMVERIHAATDPLTQSLPIEIKILESSEAFISGMNVIVKFPRRLSHQVGLVPLSALIEGQHPYASIFVYDPQTSSVQRVQVEVCEIVDGFAVLKNNIPDAETVVITGAEFLSDSQKVQRIESTRP
jgi:RND family efflux transporter MFP subunit